MPRSQNRAEVIFSAPVLPTADGSKDMSTVLKISSVRAIGLGRLGSGHSRLIELLVFRRVGMKIWSDLGWSSRIHDGPEIRMKRLRAIGFRASGSLEHTGDCYQGFFFPEFMGGC